MTGIRDRIVGLKRVKAADLVDHPGNWRTHSDRQRAALKGIIEEVGIAGAVLVRELPDGKYGIIDGHCRREILGEADIPVLVLDVDEAEAKKLLATYDAVGDLAGMDAEKFTALRAEIDSSNDAVSQLLDEINAKALEAITTAGTSNGTSGPADYTAGQTPTISYTIVFDSDQQQETWFRFVRWLRKNHPSDTISASLTDYITTEGHEA